MSVTILIIALTSLISYQAFNDQGLFNKLKHNPYIEHRDKSYVRMLTSGFVHGNMTHLIVNMLVLYFFGRYIESYFVFKFGALWGRLIFILFYSASIVLADIPTFFKHKDHPSYSSVGASGAIAAIVFAFILHNPLENLYLYFVIPINATLFGVVYLWYSSYMSKNARDFIDHDAHFAGAVSGIFLSLLIDPGLLKDFFSQIMQLFN